MFGSMLSSSVSTLLSTSSPAHLLTLFAAVFCCLCCVMAACTRFVICLQKLFPEPGLLLRWIPQKSVRCLGRPSVDDWLDCCLARHYVCDPLVASFGFSSRLIWLKAWSLSISASSSRFCISDASFSSCCCTAARI